MARDAGLSEQLIEGVVARELQQQEKIAANAALVAQQQDDADRQRFLLISNIFDTHVFKNSNSVKLGDAVFGIINSERWYRGNPEVPDKCRARIQTFVVKVMSDYFSFAEK